MGDAYCFVAIERNTKLVLTRLLGRRTDADTQKFIQDLRRATAPPRFQISTDGFKPYVKAIVQKLKDRVDFANLVKVYATSSEGERRYSPPDVVEAVPKVVFGNPDQDLICTSHVKRQNLTIRMAMRRMTRLTNGFSKKWENLKAAYDLHFAYYNFCRVHSDAADHASNGCGDHGPCVEHCGVLYARSIYRHGRTIQQQHQHSNSGSHGCRDHHGFSGVSGGVSGHASIPNHDPKGTHAPVGVSALIGAFCFPASHSYYT